MDNEDKSHIYTSVAEALLANSEYQEAMQRSLEPLRKIAQQYTLPVQQQLSENLRKSMEPILNAYKSTVFESPAYAELFKTLNEFAARNIQLNIQPDIVNTLHSLDWESLDGLEDEDVIPEYFLAPVKEILGDCLESPAFQRIGKITKFVFLNIILQMLVTYTYNVYIGPHVEPVRDVRSSGQLNDDIRQFEEDDDQNDNNFDVDPNPEPSEITRQ